MGNDIFYSVVIPFRNEESSLEELFDSITKVMGGLHKPYEIIAIDDCSIDATYTKLQKLSNTDPLIKIVHMPVRRGQTAALAEGFSRSCGEITISIDGDLQNDPSDIPLLLKKFRESGADVICGWRWGRKDSFLTLLYSKLGNFFQRLFFRTTVHDISCTFRVYKTAALKTIALNEEGLHRFLPFLMKKRGFSVAEQKVRHNARKYGISNYSPKKALQTIRLFLEIALGKY